MKIYKIIVSGGVEQVQELQRNLSEIGFNCFLSYHGDTHYVWFPCNSIPPEIEDVLDASENVTKILSRGYRLMYESSQMVE
ncbi:MAG: hypothetical protein AABY07_01060 [Nanoarchaeota archaeon]